MSDEYDVIDWCRSCELPLSEHRLCDNCGCTMHDAVNTALEFERGLCADCLPDEEGGIIIRLARDAGRLIDWMHRTGNQDPQIHGAMAALLDRFKQAGIDTDTRHCPPREVRSGAAAPAAPSLEAA